MQTPTKIHTATDYSDVKKHIDKIYDSFTALLQPNDFVENKIRAFGHYATVPDESYGVTKAECFDFAIE